MIATSSRMITMAVCFVGDAEAVRKEMGCSYEDLLKYSAAKKQPTIAQYGALLEMILREQRKLVAKNRERITRISEQTKRSK